MSAESRKDEDQGQLLWQDLEWMKEVEQWISKMDNAIPLFRLLG